MRPSPAPYPLLRALLASLILSLTAGCGRTQSDEQLLSAARQHVAKGEPKSAVIQLKNLLQQTPANGPARLMLGQLYLDTGDTLSAEKELRRALELGTNPGDVAPLLGRWSGAARSTRCRFSCAAASLPSRKSSSACV